MPDKIFHRLKHKKQFENRSKKSGKKRAPRKITEQYLQNAAHLYLQRFASSSQNLRRILMRRIQRSCAYHGDEIDNFIPLVDSILLRFQKSGMLDDTAYAKGVAVSLRRRGQSRKKITARLKQKGLTQEHIKTAIDYADTLIMDESASHNDNAEYIAALRFAKRKKIGPYRRADKTEDRQKELAALGRAGFSYEIAQQILSLQSEELFFEPDGLI